MKKRILSLLFLLFCFIVSAQDCSSLRKPNETYGVGEGKDASWCNMQNPTAYTDCMCKQEKATEVTAAQQQELQNKALQKSTEASSLYQQAHNLATQADIGKDPSKLDKAKKLYQQAIALSNEAKGYIEQAYAGSDASYTNLKNLYLEQYNKQIEWATTGIESIVDQKERIKAETNKKQIKLTPTKASASNNWDLINDSKTDNSWAIDDKPAAEQPKKTESNKMDSWTQEETIRWIENYLKGKLREDKSRYDNIVFGQSHFIMDWHLYSQRPREKEARWRDGRTEVLFNSFKELNKISFRYYPVLRYIEIELTFECDCVKWVSEDEGGTGNYFDIYLKGNALEKDRNMQLINAFVHLAVLNGADKNNIEIDID
ncbi:hypothetical protein [Corallibacter sp.]|uniref:hypothetical protein n=1 Tax=Corallibacter sp. TaxID=2038084 RepID=UPI003A8F841A